MGNTPSSANHTLEDIDGILQGAQQRIKEINERLKNLRPDNPYTPELTPADDIFIKRPIGTNEKAKQHYEAQIELIKNETHDSIQNRVQESPLRHQMIAAKKLDEFLHPGEGKGEALQQRTSQEKDISASQDLAAKLVTDERLQQHAKSSSEKGESEKQTVKDSNTPAFKAPSFSSTLHSYPPNTDDITLKSPFDGAPEIADDFDIERE